MECKIYKSWSDDINIITERVEKSERYLSHLSKQGVKINILTEAWLKNK